LKKNKLPVEGNDSARGYALKILVEVEEGAYVNIALNRLLTGLSMAEEERTFLTKLSYGVLQRLNTLDWAIALHLTSSLEKLTPWIRNILRLGAYQLLYMERIPESAVVDESVKLAYRFGHKGVAGLVNAVLREISRAKEELPWPVRDGDPLNYLSLFYSYPLWILKRWADRIGLEETEKLCIAQNQVPPLTVRTNTLKTTREKLRELLLEEGVKVEYCQYAPDGLKLTLAKKLIDLQSFKEGLFQIQGEASMLVAPLLNPKPGESVLDLCSAPGGKTLHMANLMENKGEIIAADLYPHRLRLLQGMIERQDIRIVHTEKMDGRSLPAERQNYFQRVLLDVPCSGLGVIQRKGELKWRRKEQDIPSLASLQAELLRSAFNALKPGGALVYSACTTEPEETRDIILDFYRDEPRAEPALLAPLLPPELILQEEEGMAYLWPHEHGLDGFFLARLRKKV